MNISKREKTMIIVLIILLVFGAYYQFFFVKYQSKSKDLKNQIAAKEQEINELEQAKIQLTAFLVSKEDKLLKYEEVLKTINATFSDAVILAHLEDIIGEYIENPVIEVETSSEDIPSAVMISKFDIQFLTTYEKLIKVLDNLNKSEYKNMICNAEIYYEPVYSFYEENIIIPEGFIDFPDDFAVPTESLLLYNENDIGVNLSLEFFHLDEKVDPFGKFDFMPPDGYQEHLFMKFIIPDEIELDWTKYQVDNMGN